MEKFSAADVICDLWFVVVKFWSVHCPIDQTVGHETAPGGESWGLDCVWDVQSPFFYFNCKATTSKKKRRERKRKQKDQKTASSDSRSWRLARLGSPSCSPAVQHTDHYETRQQQQIMQIKIPQKILGMNVPSAIRLSGMQAFMIVPLAIKFLISRSIRRVPKKWNENIHKCNLNRPKKKRTKIQVTPLSSSCTIRREGKEICW